MNWKNKCTKQTVTMKSSMIRELVEMTKNVVGLVSFAGGFPSPATFPKDQLAEIYQRLIKEEGKEILQYGATGGEEELKRAIIKYEKLDISLNEIHICSGATSGIYNMLKIFIEPGDIIISEAPSFLGSIVAFEATGATVLPVSMQSDGLNIDELTAIIKNNDKGKIKFIYTIPDFQNPTGITMSNEKREKLIDIAIKNNIFILEDDPYSKLRLSGTPQKSLFEIAREKFNDKTYVVTVRSFSKLLGPGLRIGYALANNEIVKYMNSWAQKINVTSERVSQRVVAEYLDSGLLDAQIELIKSIYAPLRDKMVASLKTHMSDDIKWVEPEGGMFLWLELPENQDADEIFTKAVEKKVAFIPGSKFYPSGYEKANGLRLNFSFPTEEQIEEGIKRLASIF